MLSGKCLGLKRRPPGPFRMAIHARCPVTAEAQATTCRGQHINAAAAHTSGAGAVIHVVGSAAPWQSVGRRADDHTAPAMLRTRALRWSRCASACIEAVPAARSTAAFASPSFGASGCATKHGSLEFGNGEETENRKVVFFCLFPET